MKQQIKQGLTEYETTTLIFTSEQFQKIKWIDNKEFQLDGNLFDIVRILKKDDLYHLKVINDKQEERIFADLNRLTEQEISGCRGKSRLKQLGKFFELKYIFGVKELPEIPSRHKENHKPQKEVNILKGYFHIPVQPPEFFI